MNAEDFHDFRSSLQDEGIVFVYSGYISEDVLSGVGEAVRRKLESEDAPSAKIRNVFAVFVEQMQNIIRYSAERLDSPSSATNERVSYGILTIAEEDGVYAIRAGNEVDGDRVSHLGDLLERIRDMSREDLKTAYKDRLKAPPDPDRTGAGIGLIEIARRASEPLTFDFHQIDSARTFFAVEARI